MSAPVDPSPRNQPATTARHDETVERIISHLRARGAGGLAHARGRTLLGHLTETAAILRRWGQPPVLQHAALLHSVYGTDTYHPRLLDPSDRAELAGLAGPQPERLAHLFSATPRQPLLAGTLRWATDSIRAGGPAHAERLTPEEHDQLVMLHMANLAEQAAARDGSPSLWLTRLRDLAMLIIDSDHVVLPDFIAMLLPLEREHEAATLRAYRQALADGDRQRRRDAMALAAATNPVVAEPCIHLAREAGEPELARAWRLEGARRLRLLGTAWDKRSTYEEWLELTAAPVDARGQTPPPGDRASRKRTAAANRFLRYMETLAETGQGARPAAPGIYPGLPAHPFHDPGEVPLARHLEEHFEQIRAELAALAPAVFHREAEPIPRQGEWDVAFFYERGQRHDAACAACPTVTRAIETPVHRVLTTSAGLIYASRMRAGTHIAAHRGPTNLRLRCHLGIEVPAGDCAIRVQGETHRWEAGRTIVFDDSFEHEAWNHTGEDRVVLIVDLWHPDLSDEEIRLLEGLHGHVRSQAHRLSRYWRANANANADANPRATAPPTG